MKNRIKYFHFLLLFIVTAANIQIHAETFNVSGTVKTENDIPIEFANVILKTGNSNETIGAITEPDGKFEIKVSPNRYMLSVNYLGYVTYTYEIISYV